MEREEPQVEEGRFMMWILYDSGNCLYALHGSTKTSD
jgi:hypothetical protein